MILKDTTVVVSGVGTGLGREVARLALRDGARVVLAARTESVLKTTAAELDPSGERVAYLHGGADGWFGAAGGGPWCVRERTEVRVVSQSLAELAEQTWQRERALRLLRVRGSAGAFLLSRLRASHSGPILLVAPTSSRAERFAADLLSFAGGTDVRIFPRYDTPPFDRFSSHPEIEARRMSLLYGLLAAGADTPLTVIAPWTRSNRIVASPRSSIILCLRCSMILSGISPKIAP